MDEGWIKIHRQVLHHPMYYAEPFTRMQAWFDLLLLANVEDRDMYIRGIRIAVKRGMVVNSKDWLAGRWRWSRGKVTRYLDMLETEGMIEQQKSNVITCVSISKFDYYQLGGTPNGTTDGRQTDNRRTANGQQTDGRRTADSRQHKNIIENNNDSARVRTREGAVDFVPPSVEEVKAYSVDHGCPLDAARFVDYYGAKGWMAGKSPMKDWRAAVRMWSRRDREKAEQEARAKELQANRRGARSNNGTKRSNNGTTTDKDGGRAAERERERMARDAEFKRYIADTLQGDGSGS